MINIAVVGGRLQGLEATYLAKKAGYTVRLIDKSSTVPALMVADSFCQADLLSDTTTGNLFRGIDLILPAMENRKVLEKLSRISEETEIPLAFDLAAYDVTYSKHKSDLLFAELGIPAPVPYPGAEFPLLVKPSDSSGSDNVKIINDEKNFNLFLNQIGPGQDGWIIQEYLQGPSYSIEIFGCKDDHIPLVVTDLEMDESYDCKRVLVPSVLKDSLSLELAEIARKIALKLRLKGIMDVEVIEHGGQLKILEIDARLPSQTPTAVFHSSGINMVELLASYYLWNQHPVIDSLTNRAVIFEHITLSGGRLAVSGEHLIAGAGPLKHFYNFFGADEALSNYCPGSNKWVATLIICSDNPEKALFKRENIIRDIIDEMKVKKYVDPVPLQPGSLLRGAEQ